MDFGHGKRLNILGHPKIPPLYIRFALGRVGQHPYMLLDTRQVRASA